jgi:hypothetical protein
MKDELVMRVVAVQDLKAERDHAPREQDVLECPHCTVCYTLQIRPAGASVKEYASGISQALRMLMQIIAVEHDMGRHSPSLEIPYRCGVGGA